MTVAGAPRALPYGFDEADLPPKADDRDITAPARPVNIIHILKYISVVCSDQDQARGVQRIVHEQRCAPEEATRGKLEGGVASLVIDLPAHHGPQGQRQDMIVSAEVSSIPLRR